MISLPIKDLTFKDLERNFFELGCEIARNMMQQFLEQADEDLARNRNKAQLRHKGKKTTTIKTLMGEVVFSRNIYKKVTDDGQVQHIYLLDEALGFEKSEPYPLTWQKRSSNSAAIKPTVK